MNKLIKYEDYIFLDKNYNEFLNYFKELTNKDDCVTVFTNEVAIPYFLKNLLALNIILCTQQIL